MEKTEPEKATDPKLEEFERLGMKASYHFADDTCKEWDQGNAAKQAAMKLYYAGTEEEKVQMLLVSKKFLWSLKMQVEADARRG